LLNSQSWKAYMDEKIPFRSEFSVSKRFLKKKGATPFFWSQH
jgi:hypothetical protein